jgi:hypothetical protein
MSDEGLSGIWGSIHPTKDIGQPSLLVRGWDKPTEGNSEFVFWRPPADITRELPEGFCVPFRIHTAQDGFRRIAALGYWEKKPRLQLKCDLFVTLAQAGGFALLCRDERLD